MLKSKTIDRIGCAALAVMLLIACGVWVGKASVGRQNTVQVGYEQLFDPSVVHTIDIEMADWDGFIASATQEEYVPCAVTIDGEKITDVGIRGKGNTSLSSVAGMGSRKYSFKIEFDQFVKGRTYRGLDKLSLNNLIYDATMMKDYLAYTLMGKMGVPSPLCSYVQITVNGEPWGLYLAVEGVEDAFLERNNLTAGALYKPDSMSFGGGRGNGRDFDFERFRNQESNDAADNADSATPAENGNQEFSASFGGSSGDAAPSPDADGSSGSQGSSGNSAAPQGQESDGFSASSGMPALPGGVTLPDAVRENLRGGFNFGMGSSDVKLQYIDDDPDSYANIFDNAKTQITRQDKNRLIRTLKTLSGENAQDAVFADEVICYLAVHDFLQNDDSYTGMIVHNYYLYEEKGKLAIIPWDYNLAFGAQSMGFGSSGAADLINSPIDSPVSDGDVSDRPLVAWIFSGDEALARYHEIYGQFAADIIESGWLKSEIDRVAAMIRPYVEADENSFYSAEEMDAGVQALQAYCALRGESIRGQLNGTIPSTSAGQRADNTALVDAGSLSISDMGVMNMGGFNRGNQSSVPAVQPSGQGGGQDLPSGDPFGSSGGASAAERDTNMPEPEQPSAPMPGEAAADEARSSQRTFPMAPNAPENGSAGGLSWLGLGAFVLALLLAIALVMRVPGHEG